MSKYQLPSVAADAIVIRLVQGTDKNTITNVMEQLHVFEILLITRKNQPFQNCLAFPGGFVDYNEDPSHAVTRELKEEATLVGIKPHLIGVYGNPTRDPRRHVISIAYAVQVPDMSTLQAADDAAKAHFVNLGDVFAKKHDMAFDHQLIVDDVVAWFVEKGFAQGYCS